MGKFNSVCVLGLGYIGLPTASLLGTKGYNVVGVDVSQDVVDTINRGEIHIVEPDLDLLVKSAVNSGKLKASTTPSPADIFIIAVPTPFKENHKPDLSYVESATRAIVPHIKPGNLVILESTSPVGTTDDVVAKILKEEGFDTSCEVHVAHCPERVLPGRILIELIQNDRIVGGTSQAATEMAASFYEEFVNGEVLRTDAKTAEMSKLTENSFRDVNIAFANELSIICDDEHIDVWELISLANRHPRVNVLQPGPGVGGHCIAVDPWFIIDRAGSKAKLIRAAREVNDSKPQWVIDKVTEKAKKFRRPVIACLGLAFKANVDDLRESPAHEIVKALQAKNIADLLICEPNIKTHPDFELTEYNEAIDKADILLILVDHKEFKTIQPTVFIEKMVIDTRGITK
ncbi:UDP-N-acetyl-D-mannosamine dehydrogenase [Gammaproteobacteria bacterium 42_54_T18]|nr:UDP-N-acetyl-D-mannosamine dehydrogenase [Gammaproteobacteria bacterium 42_54_T18]